ncbi:MmgE/PrpD family protein [Robbsia sp. KACC 23696]|uniref:MmgE/PrpD family protein n=1 Tax=Robbsia sp. KACC 23696 TaxID=3149231 RepID=UPI00325B18CC
MTERLDVSANGGAVDAARLPESAVQRIARWVVGVGADNTPMPVRRVAGRALIDTVAVALAGSTTDIARKTLDVMQSSQYAASTPGAAVWHNDGARLAAGGAAFANAVAAHALDYDDNCYAGFVHGSAVIAPAAFAATEMVRGSGATLIDAFIAGAEAEFALASALGRGPYDRGWWTTGLYGAFGACAAACRALALSVEQTSAALGLAVVGSAGMKAGFGSDAKAILLGNAAQQGVMMALLARQGCSGPAHALEGPNGFAALINGGVFDVDALRLGQTWRLLTPGLDIKRIPVCLSSHAAADALAEMLGHSAEDAYDRDTIVAIDCDVPPIVLKNLIYSNPQTAQQAQFSMQFALACICCDGEVTLDSLTPAVLARDDIRAAMNRVSMHSSERWDATLCERAPEGAFVTVRFADGGTMQAFRDYPVGAASKPLSDAQLQQKFLDCATRAMPEASARRILDTLGDIETLATLDTLFP